MPDPMAELPSLEYRCAWDLCAAEVHRCGGPAVLCASSPFHARELLRRIDALRPASVLVGGVGKELVDLVQRLGPEVQVAQAWSVAAPGLRPGIDVWAETAGVAGLGMPGRLAAAAVWAEPDVEGAGHALQSLQRYLAAGGRLCVILSGPLARALPEWAQGREGPAIHPLGLRRTAQRLRQAGFAVQAVYGFHGPASVAWSYGYRLAEAMRWPHLADRALAQLRVGYVVHGRAAHLAPVRVLLGSREGTLP